MLTRRDVTRADSRRRHPLPDREGILSPQLTPHPRRGKAGEDHLRMEKHHPSACFALSQSENNPDPQGNFIPFTRGKASGFCVRMFPNVSARMLGPYRIHGLGFLPNIGSKPRPRRGKAGGDHLRMEKHHPSACFALSQSENNPDPQGNFIPFTRGKASGNLPHPRLNVPARMPGHYGINRSRAGG